MMNYNEFAEAVKNQIKDYLPPEYKDVEVQNVKAKKNNDVEREGIAIKYSAKISAVFYPQELYIPYQKGESFEYIMKKMAIAFLDSMVPEDQVLDIYSQYGVMKEKLFVGVCNAGKNVDMLQNVPHEIREDLALIYKVYLEFDDGSGGTFTVHNELMESWGISETELQDQAWNNMHKILPYSLKTMEDVLREYAVVNEMEDEEIEALIKGAKETGLYVLTNKVEKFGAGYMFDNDLLEQISQKLGGDLMVIPSSLHEVLLKKVDKDITFETMKSIIEDVNKTGVIPEEILSDKLYVYDFVEKKLAIAKVEDPVKEQCVEQGLDMWPEEDPESEQEPQLAEGLMTFREFKNTVLKEIRNYLPKDFEGQISIEAVKRYDLPPNDELIIRQNGPKFEPHIDLRPYYDFHKARVGMEDILRNIASVYRTEIAQAQEYVQRAGNEECAEAADEMVESPENEGQNLGMEQSM
ncbi:MAG: hypothetical protein IKK03_09880 [Lachnospiraceae bacterium]|nr:hypothetical protein [Lachnospiraceae bacterium]